MNDVGGAESKKRGCGTYAIWGLAGIVGLGILGSLLPEPEGTDASAVAEQAGEPPLAVTASELHTAFEANEVAAQAQYGDQPLLITGTIDSITLDFMDEPVVALRTGNQFQSVQVSFGKKDAAAVGALASGQEFAAVCSELGEVIGTPMLDDCVLQ